MFSAHNAMIMTQGKFGCENANLALKIPDIIDNLKTKLKDHVLVFQYSIDPFHWFSHVYMMQVIEINQKRN